MAFFYFHFPSSLGALFVSTTSFKLNMNFSTNLYESGICTQDLYTELFAEPARADVAIKLWRINFIMSSCILLLDYLLINTVINSLQRLNSSNFHRIQMHLNRPILYIELIIKYKTILILKSKNLTCGLWSEIIIKS